MQCPVCNHEAPKSDVGDPLRCSECGVDYNKALSAKQRNESGADQLSASSERISLRQRKILWIMAGIAAVAIAGFASAPYVAVYQIRQAAQAQDADSLAEHIDFPRVREDLKEQVNASIMSKAKTELKDNPFASLATAFASGIAEKMISTLVTPSGLVELMKGEKPGKLISGGGTNRTVTPRDNKLFEDAHMRYDGFSKFVIEVPDKNGGAPSQFILRDGLK